MRSYPLYIDGEDREGEGWTYVVHADHLVRDPRGTFVAKRRLELGRDVRDEDYELCAARCAWGDEQHVEDALRAARRAADEFIDVGVDERRRIAERLRERFVERHEELIEVLIAEGHPRRLAEIEAEGFIVGLDDRTLDWCFAQMHAEYEVDGRTVSLTRKPDGVVCVSPPTNAGANSAALGIFAILAGNALVVKAPRTAPLGVMYVYRELVAPVLEEAGAPKGLLNVVSGWTRKILESWIDSPLVDDIMYFGDTPAGMKFAGDCLARGKKAILELSGNDAFVVWRDADVAAAADSLCQSFYGSTQICMVPKHALVHPEIADEFLEAFAERVREVRPGLPSDPDVVLSPVLKVDKFFDMLAETEHQGSQRLTGGRRVDERGESAPAGLFLEPTVVRVDGLEVGRQLRCVTEETFFPLLPVVVLEPGSDEEVLQRVLEHVNANPYGLRNSLWAADEDVIDTFVRRARNGGQLQVNTQHLALSPYVATHGGTAGTGGPHGELNYPMLRTSHLQAANVLHSREALAAAGSASDMRRSA